MKNKKKILKGIKNESLKNKLGDKCVYCGCSNPLILTIDHRNPTARGGIDEDKNKQIACFICNQLKGALTHAEFKLYFRSLLNLHKLKKVSFFIPQPKLTLHPHAFPATEEMVKNEIKKESAETAIEKKMRELARKADDAEVSGEQDE